MDLVVDQVVELEDVHVAHRHRLGERLAGPTVEQPGLPAAVDEPHAVASLARRVEQTGDDVLAGAVEHRAGHSGTGLGHVVVGRDGPRPVGRALDLPPAASCPTQVQLEDLPDVHAAGNTHRVEHDVDRRAVLKEGHVLDREDLGDDALVAVAAGELVAVGDLALVGDIDPHELVDAGGQVVAVVLVKDLDADDRAGLTVGHLEGRVANLAGLLAEDRAQQALLRGQLGLTLGRDLADEQVAVADLGTDADDPALVEVGQNLFGDVGDVPRDLLRAQLGVAGVDLVLLDVDRGEDVVLDQTLGEDDRVLVVVPFPRHERHEQVAPEGHLAAVGRGAVSNDRALLKARALIDTDDLVVAVALVGPVELGDAVGAVRAVVLSHRDQVGAHLGDDTRGLGDNHVTGVDGRAVFHPGADQRRLGLDQRHRLALHVGAHERAVGVIVLEERNERGRRGHHLARRDIHVVDVDARDVFGLATLGADQDPLLGEGPVRVERSVGLRLDEEVFLIGRQVVDLVGDDPVDDLAVGGLDEPERVDPAIGGQRADEADVGAFRRLDRAHPAVVAGVDVTDLHAGAVPRETAGAEGREATLVGQPGQRVVLVHELRELAGAEELADRGHDRTDVDQGLRRDRLDVLGGHPLANHTLHPGQARADLVLDELADAAQTTVAEVVDVVGLDEQLDRLAVATTGQGRLAGVQGHDVADGRDDVVDRQRGGRQRRLDPELLAQLVPANLGQVIPLGVEVEVVQQGLRGLLGRRLARAQLAVDVQQRVVLALGVVLLQGQTHRLVVPEVLEDLVVGPAERLEQHGDRLLALAVDADADHVALVDLELQPGAAARDELRGVDVLVGRLVGSALEVGAGRPDQLRDDDPLGAVDDERPALGHEREVTHEDRLALDLASVGVHELGGHEQGRVVGLVALLAGLDGLAGLLEPVVAERQRHRSREVLDGGDFLEDLFEAGAVGNVSAPGCLGRRDASLPALVAEQPVEALRLQRQQIWNLERLVDLGEAQPT
ncbi:MAG: hypothetical protein BWY91_01843 [bacterium ADurb.BinA028]|nr:MAG: hypothetical protein BWY91_01843 [bacterium ADurb.BinA028]